MSPEFELSIEKREYMLTLIKDYFREERDEEIGDLAAILMLDFFMSELAPEFYNQGVFDAYLYVTRTADGILELQKIQR